ncbi:putative DNA-binding protein [Hoeflea marina]|uniref:Putative DNA-binding protein n=2 Tax=Hoeflea marina TaxID=274592 RepID=A0A317PD69_9HYPH|nr:putative DNA-binding protein [Hoeflea marina]
MQAGFAASLLAPDLPVPAGVVGPRGKKAGKRFAVYRNNVAVGLAGALGDIFPVVRKLVGDGFFRAMALVYVAQEPPGSPLMFEYGQGFAAFLEDFEPVSQLLYLPDVARLERAWLDAFHAADVEPLDPGALGRVAPEALAELTFTVHPATRIIDSDFAIVSIFSASREDQDISGIRPRQAQSALVTRPGDWVEVRGLPPGASTLFKALIAGVRLGEAAGDALAAHPQFDLPAALAAMLEAGVFIRCAARAPAGSLSA